MTFTTPSQALEQLAAVVNYFYPPDEATTPYRLSSNASVVGGYAESLVGTLFVPSQEHGDTLWQKATKMKTSELDPALKVDRREATGNLGRTHDKVDLYVPQPAFKEGRWRSAQVQCREAAALANLQALANGSKPYLTCQVKARFAWRGLDSHDALPYRVYIDTDDGRRWSRNDILAQRVWRVLVPDLIAWVRFTMNDGKLATKVRLAAASDVKNAIRAKALWEVSTGKSAESEYSWTGSKIDFLHVFGEKGWQDAEDLSAEDVERLKKDGWTQWAIGIDVSSVLPASA